MQEAGIQENGHKETRFPVLAPSCHLSAQNSFFLYAKLSESMSLSLVSWMDKSSENSVIIKAALYCSFTVAE